MTLDDLDRRLAGYLQAIDSMSTNLVELDEDPNRKLLAGASLTGTTAARWAAASDGLAQTWGWFSQFKDLLAEAQQIRGTKSRLPPEQSAELARILSGPCVELTTEQVPLAERGLLERTHATVHCSLEDLLAHMSAAYDEVRAITTATAKAWDALLPPLQAATEEMNRVRGLAAELGETHVPELHRVGDELDHLSSALATDPLSVDIHAADDLQQSLAAIAADLDRLALLRQQAAAEVERARTTLAELTSAVLDAQAAYTETTAKISRPRVTPPPALDPTVAAGPDQLEALSRRGNWRAFRDAVDRWTAGAARALADVQRGAEGCLAPIKARNELRGRLDAYRAKASAYGLLEDPATDALYEQARSVLYTAPTDLAAAVTLVDRYRQLIATTPKREATT